MDVYSKNTHSLIPCSSNFVVNPRSFRGMFPHKDNQTRAILHISINPATNGLVSTFLYFFPIIVGYRSISFNSPNISNLRNSTRILFVVKTIKDLTFHTP